MRFSSILTVLILLFSNAVAISAQGIPYGDTSRVPGSRDLDSLKQYMNAQLQLQTDRLQTEFQNQLMARDRAIGQLEMLLDSQDAAIIQQREEIIQLEREKEQILKQQSRTEDRIQRNQRMIGMEKERFSRILIIAGLSLMGLILISMVLFFLLMMRQNNQVERRIQALRKYTHSEIENTRSDLLSMIVSRFNKFSESSREERELLKEERAEAKRERMQAKLERKRAKKERKKSEQEHQKAKKERKRAEGEVGKAQKISNSVLQKLAKGSKKRN